MSCKDCYWLGKPNSPCPGCGPTFSHYTFDRGERTSEIPYEDLIKALRSCDVPRSYYFCAKCFLRTEHGGSCGGKALLSCAAEAIEKLTSPAMLQMKDSLSDDERKRLVELLDRNFGAPTIFDNSQIVDVDLNLYDQEEIHDNCTVQILRNSYTGAVSVGRWDNDAAPKGVGHE